MRPQTRDHWNECIVAIHDLMGQMTNDEYVEACAKLQEFGRNDQPKPTAPASEIEKIAAKLGLDASKPPTVLSRLEKLERAMQGIASCATQCICCEMHRRVAEKALGYTVEITTDTLTV